MVRKPLVQPAKDITASKDSIYSDEKQSQFLEGDTLALPIEAENAYSLDRSTPLSALKQMMREHYSPNTLLDNSVASAIVLAVDIQTPSYFETIEGYIPSEKVEMLRIRVLSDPRNYWLPSPKSEEDPVVSLHPLVKKPSTLKNINVGDIIKVNFYNNKSQFSSITDIGEVMSVVSRVQRPYDRAPLVALPTVLPASIPVTNTSSTPGKPMKTSDKGKKFLEKLESFRAYPYKDSAGLWTVGIGSLIDFKNARYKNDPQVRKRFKKYEKYVIQNVGDERRGKELANNFQKAKEYYQRTKTPLITYAQAVALKGKDLTKFEKIVNRRFKDTPLKQNQFDALVSYAYNNGDVFSSVRNQVYKDPNDKVAIKKAFLTQGITVNNGATHVRGLYSRRAKEARLFSDGEYRNLKARYTFKGQEYFGNRRV
jgi:GH24 family phage-related lysozyme (muramidase)